MIFERKKYNDEQLMQMTIAQAQIAYNKNEVPVGAIIIDSNGKIIAKSYNICEKKKDPTLHAEIIAIKKACKKLNSKSLNDCRIFVSKEPCSMCATAISYVRISEIIFALPDPKGGAILYGSKIFQTQKNLFKPKIKYGLMEAESKNLIQKFFKQRRK